MDNRLPDIFYVISFLDKVYTTRNVTQFDLAAKLIEAVYDADNRVCTFKLYSKLLLGLKMKVHVSFEPRREKTGLRVSEEVRHKPACTSSEKS